MMVSMDSGENKGWPDVDLIHIYCHQSARVANLTAEWAIIHPIQTMVAIVGLGGGVLRSISSRMYISNNSAVRYVYIIGLTAHLRINLDSVEMQASWPWSVCYLSYIG